MATLRTRDGTLYYEVHGAGPPLVCLTGVGNHAGSWVSLVGLLAARHRVVLLDNRGTGRSSIPPGPYAVEQLAGDVLAVLDALEIERADVLGHSMGGFVAQELAAHHGSRIRRLVLYSTAVRMCWPARRHFESIVQIWEEVPEISGGALVRLQLPWQWSPRILADATYVDGFIALADRNPYKTTLDGFRAQVSACAGFSGAALLGAIHAPTLVVGGQHDLLAPVAEQHFLVDQIAGARLALSDAAHNTHLERRNWFADTVLGFTTPDPS